MIWVTNISYRYYLQQCPSWTPSTMVFMRSMWVHVGPNNQISSNTNSPPNHIRSHVLSVFCKLSYLLSLWYIQGLPLTLDPRICILQYIIEGCFSLLSLNHLQRPWFSSIEDDYESPLMHTFLILSFLATPHIYLRTCISATCALAASHFSIANIVLNTEKHIIPHGTLILITLSNKSIMRTHAKTPIHMHAMQKI